MPGMWHAGGWHARHGGQAGQAGQAQQADGIVWCVSVGLQVLA